MAPAASPAPIRLRIPLRRRFRPGGPTALVGLAGLAVGIAGLLELETHGPSVTTTGKVGFTIFGAVCILLGGYLFYAGGRLFLQRARSLPRMEATRDVVRLERPHRASREINREPIARVVYELRVPRHESEAPLCYLDWENAVGRSLGTWTVDPVIAGGLRKWLRELGIPLKIRRPDTEDGPEPTRRERRRAKKAEKQADEQADLDESADSDEVSAG